MNAPSPLQIVQSVYAAFARGDLSALVQQLDTEVSWRFIGDPTAPYTRIVRGHEGVEAWFADVARAERIETFEPREFLAGLDHVTVMGWERSVALPGGRAFEADWVHVWIVRDGKVQRFVGIFDTASAARARGSM